MLQPGTTLDHDRYRIETVIGRGGFGYDDGDWTHATVSASTTFEIGIFYVTPAIAYQFELDDAWNDEDELYGSLSSGFTF